MSSPKPVPLAPPQSPSLALRTTSSMIMGLTGILSRSVLYGLNTVEVTGLQGFLNVLDSRRDPEKRQRGLITVSNHVSVLDDPLVWGLLPLSYAFNPSNLRWTLGAHDICFKNKFLTNFFTCGQVLPAHRLKYSPHGGLFQSSLTQAIRLLSGQPYSTVIDTNNHHRHHAQTRTTTPPDIPDPFTAGSLTYTTNGIDVVPSPSVYPSNRRSWVHVFPEGLVHQHPAVDLRYFKWGVARLILESEPAPDVLPMFIDGTQHMMPEFREWPRFLPRFGKHVHVAFGNVIDYDAAFGDLRRRWQALVRKSNAAAARAAAKGDSVVTMMGELPEDLKYGREANEIRIEVARRMREEVLKVRKSLGRYPDPDPALGVAETWAVDRRGERKYKSRVDGSEINQD